MASLPGQGSAADKDVWGAELNAWLLTAHNADGSLVPDAVTAASGPAITAAFADSVGATGPTGSSILIPVISTGPHGEVTSITTVEIASRPLVRTAVQSGAYTATPFDIVPYDLSAVNGTLQLPTGPPDGTTIGYGVAKLANAHTLTVTCGGSDHFQTTDGTTTRVLSTLDQAQIVQYNLGAAVWTIVSSS